MDMQQIVFLVIMATSVFLFMTDYFRVDVVSVLIILALTLTGLLDQKEAFSGFSSEPALIVGAVFVLSAGLSVTGVTDFIGQWVEKLTGRSETLASLVIMVVVAALSAFTHHLMVTAMMLPVVMQLCKDKGFHSSRLLIPMATAASLGTTLTLIGAPAFLLANQILVRGGHPPLGLFSVAKVGAPMVLASFVLISVLRWVLPKTSGVESQDDRFKLSEITTELVIPEGSRWIGKTMEELKSENEKRFEVLFRFRKHSDDHAFEPIDPLKEGDTFLVKINSDELVSIEEKLGLALKAIQKFGTQIKEDISLEGEGRRIVGAVIAPNSGFVGKTLSQLKFYDRFGVAAVGLWRKSGWVQSKISGLKLQQGDLVVLWGPEENLRELTGHSGFLMFLPFKGLSKNRMKMNLATMIMLGSILMAASGLLPAHVAFLSGAAAMVITRCLSVNQAYEAIETKIFVMIAGVIPLGMAMEKVGVDQLFARYVSSVTQGWEPFTMMMVFYWFAAILTQVLSDSATTVLIAPIAMAFAADAGISPTAAVVTVTVGAVASFLTPIGHHGNLMILSPGGYRFADFLKIGLPLTILISLMTCYLSLRVFA